jgi:hypothetical protein
MQKAYFYEPEVETCLSSIENNFKNILENKILKREEITSEEKYKVLLFISSLEIRIPLAKSNINNFIDNILNDVVKLEEQFKDGKVSQTHKELLELKDKNIGFSDYLKTAIAVNRWQFSQVLILNIEYEGDDQFFITSDAPVSLYDFTYLNSPYGIPPNSETIEVIVPLTKKVAACINNAGLEGYLNIPYNFVREVNNRTIGRSDKMIISPKELNKVFIDNLIGHRRQSFILFALKDFLPFDKKFN